MFFFSLRRLNSIEGTHIHIPFHYLLGSVIKRIDETQKYYIELNQL